LLGNGDEDVDDDLEGNDVKNAELISY